MNNNGEVEVTDILDDSVSGEEWIPFKSPHVDVQNLFNNELGKFIRLYSFAEKLKQMSVDILGLKSEWVFGTDEQKNTPTHFQWNEFSKTKSGPMTAREVLQHVGTEMFRSFHSSVWVDACLKQIEEDGSELALISDVRFKNEISAIQDQGGVVIGLQRNPTKKADEHSSETEMDDSFELCDFVIDNREMSIPEQNKQIYLTIKDLNNIPSIS